MKLRAAETRSTGNTITWRGITKKGSRSNRWRVRQGGRRQGRAGQEDAVYSVRVAFVIKRLVRRPAPPSVRHYRVRIVSQKTAWSTWWKGREGSFFFLGLETTSTLFTIRSYVPRARVSLSRLSTRRDATRRARNAVTRECIKTASTGTGNKRGLRRGAGDPINPPYSRRQSELSR